MSQVSRTRKRKPATLSRRARRLVFAGGALALASAALVGGGWLAWHSGWVTARTRAIETAFYTRTAEWGLVVRKALVQGRHRTTREDVLDALDIEVGAPIFAVDLEAARRRLEALPWVGRADVSRRLPGTVFVRLVERKPMALWQHDGKLVVVDPTGAVLSREVSPHFAHLPVMAGDGALIEAPALMARLAHYPELAARLTAAVRVGERRWNLRFDNEVEVRLPENDLDRALARLARLEAEAQILSRGLAVVDLRLEDRITIQPNKGNAVHLARGGRDT